MSCISPRRDFSQCSATTLSVLHEGVTNESSSNGLCKYMKIPIVKTNWYVDGCIGGPHGIFIVGKN